MGLRGTQQAAFDAAIDAFKKGQDRVLLVEPTGWGKTYFTAELFRHCVETWGINCLFVVHTKELAKQTYEAFCENGMERRSRLLCAGLGSKEVGQITVGTKQTISRCLEKLNKVNLLVIDECHYMADGDEYHKIINHCSHNRLRILGLTATPYRLNEGWIYGDGKFWSDFTHMTSLDEMIGLGFLSKYRYKMAESMDEELEKVKKIGGEFSESELSGIMVEERHLGSIEHAITEHAEGRKKIIIFAVSIEHADAIAERLNCDVLHSKIHEDEWRLRMDNFKNGPNRFIVNVQQMTVGVNIPEVDCLIIARPTMSTSLHCQIAGRALRICEGKKDALIIDMVGNYLRHGLPSNPKVRKPKDKQDKKEKKEKGQNVCPECFEIVEGTETICPNCGALLAAKQEQKEINEKVKLMEIEEEKKRHRVERFGEKNTITKQGNEGIRFWIKVTGRDLPLFKFCGNGTNKIERTRERLNRLRVGEAVNIVNTAYGDWVV